MRSVIFRSESRRFRKRPELEFRVDLNALRLEILRVPSRFKRGMGNRKKTRSNHDVAKEAAERRRADNNGCNGAN